jgi:hypothetical protein
MEKARCMLREANLPETFWGEAVRMANYLKNRSPTKCCGDRVPIDWWMDRKPSVTYLKRFGCAGFVHIPKQKRHGKFAMRSTKMIFIGYPEHSKGYRFWDIREKRVVTSRDVRFNEDDNGWDLQEEQTEDGEKTEEEKSFRFFGVGDTEHEDIIHEDEMVEAQEDVQEIESEEDERESEEPIVVVQEIEDDRRVLRPRNEKIRPQKYTAISKMEEDDEIHGSLDKEEESDLKERAGKSKSKYEKKKRRLQRIKARKEDLNLNLMARKDKEEKKKNVNLNPVVKIEKEGNWCTLDPFSKYAPSFSDFED